ncbi:hypothetical protein ABT173_35500 [Streptomyces sp. NPDC001795]|uniref:hypothetical protein n=1 Tax=unclassified Streptomyces TaxID=2593676 RepID=UPI0033265B5F
MLNLQTTFAMGGLAGDVGHHAPAEQPVARDREGRRVAGLTGGDDERGGGQRASGSPAHGP